MTHGQRYAKRMQLLGRIPAWVGIIFESHTCYDKLGVNVRAYVPLFFTTLHWEWHIPAAKLV